MVDRTVEHFKIQLQKKMKKKAQEKAASAAGAAAGGTPGEVCSLTSDKSHIFKSTWEHFQINFGTFYSGFVKVQGVPSAGACGLG